MGLFDDAFPKAGNGGILPYGLPDRPPDLPDWLWQDPQRLSAMPTANAGPSALPDNLRKNQTASYDNKAAFNEIKQAYDNGVGAGHNSDRIKRDMTRVIQSQIDRGIFISCHLPGRAADIRTKPQTGYPAMTDRERRILRQIVEDQEHGGMIREGDHIHLQFR